MSNNKDLITKSAVVKENQMGALFKVELEDGSVALATVSGKIRKHRIIILPGDKVQVEFSPHDLSRGRINYRYR